MKEAQCINTIWNIDLRNQNGLEELEAFLEQGGNPNETKLADDYSRMFFLQRAIVYSDAKAVALLLKFGADVDCVSPTAQSVSSPLSLASEAGDSEICEMLVHHGADVNQLGLGTFLPGTFNIPYTGNFPLYAAARGGHAEVVRLLIKHGANPNNIRGYTRLPITPPDTPIAIATKEGHYDAVSALIEGSADVNLMHPSGFSALHEAILNSHLEIFYLLVESGVDIHQRGSIYGKTPLWMARDVGRRRPSEANIEIQAYLQEHGGVARIYLWAEILRIMNFLPFV